MKDCSRGVDIGGQYRYTAFSIQYEVIMRPRVVKTVEEAIAYANRVGFPVIVRSVFSLQWERTAYSFNELPLIVAEGLKLSPMTELQLSPASLPLRK